MVYATENQDRQDLVKPDNLRSEQCQVLSRHIGFLY